jgi:hypothetical protein
MGGRDGCSNLVERALLLTYDLTSTSQLVAVAYAKRGRTLAGKYKNNRICSLDSYTPCKVGALWHKTLYKLSHSKSIQKEGN